MTNYLIADTLTRIRNASRARHSSTIIKYNKLSLALIQVLMAEGYITDFHLQHDTTQVKTIKVFLKYKGWWIKKPLFSTLKCISRPGQRVFSGYKNFNKIMHQLKYNQGTAIISTSIGVMSHFKAAKIKKGGEFICYIE
jgi:small subunit ribosomal protein S8